MRSDIVSATTGGLRDLMSAIIEFGRDTASDPNLIQSDVQNLLTVRYFKSIKCYTF